MFLVGTLCSYFILFLKLCCLDWPEHFCGDQTDLSLTLPLLRKYWDQRCVPPTVTGQPYTSILSDYLPAFL